MSDVLQRAIDACKGGPSLAERIGASSQQLSNWKARNRVPAEKCPVIERAVDGAVRCEELRPDIDWGYLRVRPFTAADDAVAQRTEHLVQVVNRPTD